MLVYGVLALNNSTFGDYLDHIYPIQHEIKGITNTSRSASYPDLHLENDLFKVAEYMSPRIFSVYCSHNPLLLLPFTCHRICKQCNTTDATSEAGTSYPSSTTYGNRVAKSYVSCGVLWIIVCAFSVGHCIVI